MTWTRAVPAKDLSAARPWLPVRVGGIDLAIAAVASTWYAVEDRCSHAGCAFSEEASLRGLEIVCGCHGSAFDIRDGAVRRGPAERTIRVFAVRVEEDWLEVDI